MMKVHVLQQTITSGSRVFPVYVGFMTAENLLKVAAVPNFAENTPNRSIAENVVCPPVVEWQRPLIQTKRDKIIQTFDGSGEFMPNPVLLSERSVGGPTGVRIDTLMATGDVPTEVKVVVIPETEDSDRPLWIIDGQHRISGLGDPQCPQKSNPIPVVLLLNCGEQFYNGPTLAKIFAQVTTEATPLKALHKEWLSFAFSLDEYSSSESKQHAMECVAELCFRPQNSVTNKPNGFHDDIQFNDDFKTTSSSFLGWQYDCKDLATQISRGYYGEAVEGGQHLAPRELADQISMAFDVLKRNVRAPQEESAFFGNSNHCHKIMGDAFLAGVLSFLRGRAVSPKESDWDALLKALHFEEADWNLQRNVVSGSKWNEKSKTLARDVFSQVFVDETLPPNVNSLPDYLLGDQWSIEMEMRKVNANDNHIRQGLVTAKFGRGDKKSQPMDKRRYFKIAKRSLNAKHIQIFDEKSSPATPIMFKQTGEYLREPKVDPNNPSQDPLILTIKCILYGGNEETIEIQLTGWKP